MTKILRSVGVAAAFAVASIMNGQAGAMPVGGSGKAALEQIGLVEQAQYTYEGKEYCWYDDGWNGPGWYVCGQYTVRGVGWGGGAGWHGWTHTSSSTVVHGRTVHGRTVTTGAGRTGGGRTGSDVSGRTGGGRTGGGRTGGGRTGGGRTGGSKSGGKGGGRRH